MKTQNPSINAALYELERAGIRDVEIARGTKHPQLRFRINGGDLRVFAVPGTASDWRSPENTARDMRRLLREVGVITTPDQKPAPPPRQPSRVELLEQRVAALERAVEAITTRAKEAGRHE
jgi:hypothetical protein